MVCACLCACVLVCVRACVRSCMCVLEMTYKQMLVVQGCVHVCVGDDVQAEAVGAKGYAPDYWALPLCPVPLPAFAAR